MSDLRERSGWTRRRTLAGFSAAALLGAGLLLTPPVAAAAPFPAFALPFAIGQNVSSAGIHSNNGRSDVMNAIDLSPRDGVVRAPLGGVVGIQSCSGGDWVTIDHENGWRTGYYHMENIAVTDGQVVEPGTVLGDTGNALPCGGSSTGAHVHFTLWALDGVAVSRDAAGTAPIAAGNWDGLAYEQVSGEVAAEVGEPFDGKVLGGWKFTAGTEQYSGTAQRVSDGRTVKLPGRFKYDAE